MSIKRIGAAFLTAIFILSTPFVASASGAETYAGNGSWDYVGSQKFAVQSNEVKSNGGDFKFCSNKANTYMLYDSANNKTKALIGTRNLKKNECAIFRNLNKYVDGSNNKAEFIVVKKLIGSPAIDLLKQTIKFYD